MSLDLYPAIDVRAGRVVRLAQGAYDRETIYGVDPVATAVAFVEQGARWVHVVDLDAARSGSPENRPVVAAIVRAVAGAAHVQTGGGIRSRDDAAGLADVGVARVVMGSAAVADPSLVERVASIIDVAVGLDHRDGRLAIHGWTEDSDVELVAAFRRYPAAAAFVVTDISRDGMLAGPDVAGLRVAAAVSPVPVIASGGVAGLADLVTLAEVAGLAGVITGRAIYEGRFTVAEAVAALAGVA